MLSRYSSRTVPRASVTVRASMMTSPSISLDEVRSSLMVTSEDMAGVYLQGTKGPSMSRHPGDAVCRVCT